MVLRAAIVTLLSLFWALPVFAGPAASVVFFSGQPVVLAENGVSRQLLRGADVLAGETIETRDGRVQLRFRDGASMSLQPGTTFRVDRFRYTAGDKAVAEDGVLMTLVKGGLRTVTGWLGKRDRKQYQLGTTVATIGIRGTEYSAELDGAGLVVRTYVGIVEVCSKVGCVDVPGGKEVWVRSLDEAPRLRENDGKGADAIQAVPEVPLKLEAGEQVRPPAGMAGEAPPLPAGRHGKF